MPLPESLPDDPRALRRRLAALDAERARLLERLARLEATAGRRLRAPPPRRSGSSPIGSPDGRTDTYAVRWESRTTGRSGYAPACAHEWKPPLCRKPEIKCSACPNRELLPLTDDVLLGHLRGRHVVGVYPLRADATCSFLAFDLDKQSWREDARAVRDAARDLYLDPLVERSRSGNGAHVWLFFAEPVSAARARRVGDRILHRATNLRDRLPLSSFDRMFPNQDDVPAGGFGNLIALPLQRAARDRGNATFLDDAMEPVTDPWPLLARVERVDADTVDRLALPAAQPGEEIRAKRSAPWTRRAGRPTTPRPLEGRRVHVVRANRLYVRRRSLPSGALAAVRRLATRRNPTYPRKRRAGLSTYGTPRFVAAVEDHRDWIGLPRGLEDDLVKLVETRGGMLRVRDRRQQGTPQDLVFQGQLRPRQQRAVAAMRPADCGVLVAPPGSGKTVLGLALAAERGVSTLVLVHRTSLA